MERPTYIASDVHLGAVPRATELAFLAFLRRVRDTGAALLLAGDIFDFWFEYGPVIPGRHFRVLAAIASVVEAGVPVTFAGGNHDAWGGAFLRDEVGLTFHADPFHMQLAGRRALVAHGDGVGRGDLKYRALKTLLRSRATIGAFRALHPELGVRLARRVSSTEMKAGRDGDAAAAERARHIEAWARGQLEADAGLDLVVCGHAHRPACVQVAPGQWYLNAGDWITHFSYITLLPGSDPVVSTWPRDGTT